MNRQTVASAASVALGVTLGTLAVAVPSFDASAPFQVTRTPGEPGAVHVAVDQLEVVSVFEIPDVAAGVGTNSAHLAPDGQHFALLNQHICIYTTEYVEEMCLDDVIDNVTGPLDSESVRWSPDSRYLVLPQSFRPKGVDPDLWILDTHTGSLTNITEDQIGAIDLEDSNTTLDSLDIVPRWSADGSRLLFLRYTYAGGVYGGPTVYSISPDGDDLQPVVTLDAHGRLSILAVAWSLDGNQLAMSHDSRAGYVDDGIWLLELTGLTREEVWSSNLVPSGLAFSADGQYLLAYEWPWLPPDAPMQPFRTTILSLDDGEHQPVDERFWWTLGAGWSPTGSELAYLVVDNQNSALSGLYLMAEPGEPGRQVLSGVFGMPTPYVTQPLTWTANNTLLLSLPSGKGIVIVRLGVPNTDS